MELSRRKICQQGELSYPPALNAVNAIRMTMGAHNTDNNHLLTGEIDLDEAYFGGRRKSNRGRGAAGKMPVFGILERDGIVRGDVVTDVSAKKLLNLTITTV